MPRILTQRLRLASVCLALAGAAGLMVATGAGGPPPTDAPAAEPMPLVFAYYLPDCPVMEEEIDPAHAVVHEVQGREVRFCCDSCVEEFERHPQAGFDAINERMIEDQLPLYPLTTCLVMDSHEMGDDAVNVIYKNRLVRFCCSGCIGKFEADPEKYLHALDNAAVAAQIVEYPLDECVVAGHAIADGEHPTQVVVAGRLVRLCCGDCMEELLRNPAEYVKMVDEAWEAQRAAHAEHAAPRTAPRSGGGHDGHAGHGGH